MQEINFIRPQEVYDRNTGESKVRYRSYDGNDRFIPVVDGEKGVPKTMVEVTYAELKAMRDNGKLTAGALYRITDYNCTTTQENTQSAGHQFDIVLLALSESKLAEEGWAMQSNVVDMFNDYDIYTITFSDGVSKEYYLKIIEIPDEEDPDNPYLNTRFVDVKTFRGSEVPNSEIEYSGFIIDDENKTATNAYISSTQFEELLTVEYSHNYFQNSNLSAWKVWYCLDNDTARFAWADDSVDEDVPASIMENGGSAIYAKAPQNDEEEGGTIYYCWKNKVNDDKRWTTSQEPKGGDTTYVKKGGFIEAGTVASYTPAHEGTGLPNGRGVIYRLIDEWNNDVAYDFKNIQFVRPMTDGALDTSTGTDTWVYTYTQYDSDNNILVDTSLSGGMMDGFIGIYNGAELSNNVILNPFGYTIKLVGTLSSYCTISNSSGLLLFNCDALEIDGVSDAIYIGGKKVLTEE